MKSTPVFFWLLLLLWSCSDIPNENEIIGQQPNVVIIIADDQGWGDLEINGNPYINTPNIDGIAKQGARFDRFYVSPVCSPTRAELLTGRYHPRTGVYATSAGGERIDLDEKLISEFFLEAGYRTAAFGKWHSGQQYPYHPNSRGFEEFYGYCSGHWGSYFDAELEHNGDITRGEGYLTDHLTDRAISYIEENGERPFFLYLALNTPHSPMQVPDKWWDEISQTSYEHRYAGREDTTHTRAAYAMVENIDWNTGRLIKTLENKELMDNTIVLYLSDNGPNGWRWNDGLEGIKGHTDEGGVRSPLHIQWNGNIEAGKTISTPAAAIDLLPTLAGLTGISLPDTIQFDGVDLSGNLLGENSETLKRYIFSHWRGNVSLRDERFLLDKDEKLYDLSSDPGQQTDISKSSADIYSAMMAARSEWINGVLSKLDPTMKRPFTITSEGKVHLPAADGLPHGSIVRSNRYPNSSYFTNWNNPRDSITWNVEVMDPGTYEAEIFYTSNSEGIGTKIQLRFKKQMATGRIEEPHEPPIVGAENDRIPRQESYIKDFKPLQLGRIYLPESRGTLSLRALDVNDKALLETNLLVLKRVSDP